MLNVLRTRPLELHPEYIIVLSLQMPHFLGPAVRPSLKNLYFITCEDKSPCKEQVSSLPSMHCSGWRWMGCLWTLCMSAERKKILGSDRHRHKREVLACSGDERLPLPQSETVRGVSVTANLLLVRARQSFTNSSSKSTKSNAADRAWLWLCVGGRAHVSGGVKHARLCVCFKVHTRAL